MSVERPALCVWCVRAWRGVLCPLKVHVIRSVGSKGASVSVRPVGGLVRELSGSVSFARTEGLPSVWFFFSSYCPVVSGMVVMYAVSCEGAVGYVGCVGRVLLRVGTVRFNGSIGGRRVCVNVCFLVQGAESKGVLYFGLLSSGFFFIAFQCGGGSPCLGVLDVLVVLVVHDDR